LLAISDVEIYSIQYEQDSRETSFWFLQYYIPVDHTVFESNRATVQSDLLLLLYSKSYTLVREDVERTKENDSGAVTCQIITSNEQVRQLSGCVVLVGKVDGRCVRYIIEVTWKSIIL
jgi:hypothetical protein